MVIKKGDVLEIIWADYEVQTSNSSANIAKQEPCFLCTYGMYTCTSDDGIYYIICHNSCWENGKGCIDHTHNDHTRVLISGIAKITHLVPKPKPVRKLNKTAKTKKKKNK